VEEIAHVYSRSLFEVAKEHGKLDLIKEQLDQFTDALEQNRELAIFFFSPYFSTEEKKRGLERALVDADPTLVNFLAVLIENHRMPVIYRARRQFEALWEAENRLLPVEVTSAITLDPATVEELVRRIREQTGQNVELTSTVDPDILGGIVLRVGNSILDASIKNRLDQLRREVAKAT
jgi:F-type H+-transporting ATPase subunit delta